MSVWTPLSQSKGRLLSALTSIRIRYRSQGSGCAISFGCDGMGVFYRAVSNGTSARWPTAAAAAADFLCPVAVDAVY